MPYKDPDKKRANDAARHARMAEARRLAEIANVSEVKTRGPSQEAVAREKERLRLRGEWRKIGRLMQRLLNERGIGVKMSGIGLR